MKRPLALLLLLLPLCAHAQNLLPGDKQIIQLEETERNPFGRRGPDPARIVVEDAETEESRIQSALSAMEVSGYSEGARGRSVLLGRLKIFPGDILPPIIPRQTEILRVEEIHPDRIEIIFVEKQARPTPRKITLRYSLAPRVRYLLGIQSAPNRQPAAELLGQFPQDTTIEPVEEDSQSGQ